MGRQDAPQNRCRSSGLNAPELLSEHARFRMFSRRISPAAVDAALQYGRPRYLKGACYYSIGKRELIQSPAHLPLPEEFDGIHVVTAKDGTVITVFKNRGFRLRPGSWSHRRRTRWRR